MRLNELLNGVQIDPARLAQEAALLAERSDVSEELARLRSHVEQFQKLLAGAGETGKKLDFLLQEMQREANTLALQDPGRGVRGPGDHGLGARSQIRYRETPRTGAERRMTIEHAQQPLVFIVSGPSGSGKSTLVEKMLEVPGTMFSISCTTRPPRDTESAGKWYDFVSEAEFERRASQGEFLEYARVFGKHRYGTPRRWLEEAQRKGIGPGPRDRRAGRRTGKTRNCLPPWPFLFLPPAREELERRLRARGQDSEEAIQRRLDRAQQEIQRYTEYDFLVVNDDVERAGREVQAITVAARCLRSCLSERARKILESFGG